MNELDWQKVLTSLYRTPSPHNTQPFDFELKGNEIFFHIVHERILHVSDKERRDLFVSAGAGLKILKWSLADIGFEIIRIEENKTSFKFTFKESQKINVEELNLLKTHACYRGLFTKNKFKLKYSHPQVHFIENQEQIKKLADLYDDALEFFLSQKDYAEELWSWMRLDLSHPLFHKDGLNAEMMRLSGVMRVAAYFLMKPNVLAVLNKFKLIKSIATEKPQNLSSMGIMVIRKKSKSLLASRGELMMEAWMNLEKEKLVFCPITSLIDDQKFRIEIKNMLGLKNEPIHILRYGEKPANEILKLSPRRY